MADVGSGGNDDDDEFECSECDYKCSSEDDMIKHSAIHTSEEDTAIDVVLDSSCNNIITSEYNAYTNSAISDSQSQVYIRDNIETMVKTEPRSFEEIFVADNYHECHIGRKKIKLENLDIKLEPNLFQQSNQIDNHESVPYSTLEPQKACANDIIQYENSKELFEPKIEPNFIWESINSAHSNVDALAEDASLKINNVKVTNKSSKWQNGLELKQSLRGPKMPHLEMEVDNTGIYIPPGWKRKIFLRSRLNGGQLWFDCYYFTELGKKIRGKKEAHAYHINNPLAGFDFERLNFSKTKTIINPSQSIWEFDLINTEIYVPEGWQRILNVSINDDPRENYKIVYINPEGKRFWCKSDIDSYNSQLTSDDKDFIDVEKFNFTSRSFLDLSKGYIKDPEEDRALIKSLSLNTKKDKLLTNSHFNNSEKSESFQRLFEVRKMIKNGGNYTKILCKLCSFSCISKANAYIHIKVHIKKNSDSVIYDNTLPNNFDYFICEACHERMSIQDVKIHLESHSKEEILSRIIGVKYICNADSKVKMILHCCEYCNFACSSLNDMFKHVKEHLGDEIHTINMNKYKHSNESDENSSNIIIEKKVLVNDNQVNSPRKRKYCKKKAFNTIIKNGDEVKMNKVDLIRKRKYNGKKSLNLIVKAEDSVKLDKIDLPPKKKYSCKKLLNISSKDEGSVKIKQVDKLQKNNKKILKNIKNEESVKINQHILPQKKKKDYRQIGSSIKINEIEIEVDNTDIYIPPGWDRKVFLRYSLSNGILRFDCYYLTELGKRIKCRKDALEHQIKKPSVKFDVEKLKFSCNKTSWNPTQAIWEFDLINTEIYVPEGWQRKLNVSTNDNARQNYKIVYISPEGKRVWCTSDINLYISHSDSNIKNHIDIAKFDFTSRKYLDLSKSFKKDQEHGNALLKSNHISIENEKGFTNSNSDNPKEIEIFHNLFEYRKIARNAGSYSRLLCKLCSYSCISKANARKHVSVHIQHISNPLMFDSKLLNNFDYFICEACHERIKNRDDIDLHLQIHSNEEISSSIIGAKYVQKARSKVKTILHCCEYCNFACPKLTNIFKHMKEHSSNTNSDKIEENLLNTIIEDNLPLKKTSSHKKALNTMIKDRDSKDNQGNSSIRKKTCGKKDIEIDNTGKYIPNGWERRLYQYKLYKKGNSINQVKNVYKISYISPFKRSLSSKTEVYDHIRKLESSGFTLVLDVEKMDFSTSSHKIKGRKTIRRPVIREEIQIDNTEMYIPEGWQVKLFRNKSGTQKGRYFLCYISPFNKQIWDKQTMKKYLTRLEKRGSSLLVELNKIHFSVAKHGLTNLITDS